MNINHDPLFNREKIIEHYTKQDGVPVTYVCTSDLTASDVPVDIYYRDTPHPEFGNKYFGLYYDTVRDHMMICNADIVETLDFGMVNDGSVWHYSQSHHDYKSFPNGQMIDGGRLYCRSSPEVEFYVVRNGKFIKNHGEDLTNWMDTKEYVYPGTDCQE
jgi:hypothetical protein